MVRKLLFWLSGWLRVRVVLAGGAPLFERYLLARALGCELFLHHYLRADPERGLHNHPARWAAVLLLAGSYSERRRWMLNRTLLHHRTRELYFPDDRVFFPMEPFARRQRTLGWGFGARPAALLLKRDFHRIAAMHSERGSWSLFLMGPRTGGWGFAEDRAGWVPYREFEGAPQPFDWQSAPRGRAIERASA